MNRIQQLISDNWTIRRHELSSLMAIIMPGIISGNLEGISEILGKTKCTATAYDPYLATEWDTTDTDLPNNSVLVITLRGTLYAWESDWLARTIKEAEADPRICGIVLLVDGPGGMVSHIDKAVAAIKNCTKPTATVCEGMMASAHFWIGTCTDRTFIVSDLCEVGSVGIITTHLSLLKYFEMNGIDYREIYPDTADLKNEATRALIEKDDDSIIKARAEKIHKIFAETVAENLGIDYDPKLPIFRGRMFSGEEAVAAGYIDQIGTLDDAARYVLGVATAMQINSSLD